MPPHPLLRNSMHPFAHSPNSYGMEQVMTTTAKRATTIFLTRLHILGLPVHGLGQTVETPYSTWQAILIPVTQCVWRGCFARRIVPAGSHIYVLAPLHESKILKLYQRTGLIVRSWIFSQT